MSSSPGPMRRSKKSAVCFTEMCSVRLGKTLFAVPIAHILEIIGSARPGPVPLAPNFVGGLIHYRGEVLTTISLRYLLDLPPLDHPQDILVFESVGGCFGVLVDSVGEVFTLSSDDHEPNPSTLDVRRRTLFTGSYKLKGSLLVTLDPERLDPLYLCAAQAA